MAQISITGESIETVSDRLRTYVQTKSNWSDSWSTVSYLTAVSDVSCVAPSIPQATFVYRYGEIKREDQTIFSQNNPLNLSGEYVRIMSEDGVALWVGIITEESFSAHGASSDPAGDQSIIAYGLEHILDRISIVGAHTDQGYIDWCPSFNARESYGGALIGNSTGEGTNSLFSKNNNKWSNREIIGYLLDKYCDLPVSISGQYDILAQLYGVYYFEGLTIRQALDKLIERRRGLGWLLESDGTGTISLRVFSVFSSSVSAGDYTFDGNSNQVSLDMGEAIDVSNNITRLAQSASYDKIIVQGARAKACFTVSLGDGNLQRAWTSADETAYAAADSTARASQKFDHVYQRFIIPSSWDWTAGDGASGKSDILPSGSNGWEYPRPLLRWVPITAAGSDAGEYESPMVFVQDGSNYAMVDRLPAAGRPGAHVRMIDSDRGFCLKPSVNHIFGSGSYTYEELSDNDEPQYNYNTLVATVAIETDYKIKEVVTNSGGPEIERTLVLDVHDAEYWYIVPGTVTGVENGELVRDVSGTTVRDDRDKLGAVAALARAWYGESRAAVSLTVKKLANIVTLGSIITEVSSSWHREAINTVATSRRRDYINATTTIDTGYSDLDVTAMLDIPGMSDFRSVGRAFNRQKKEIDELKARVGQLPSRMVTPSMTESGEASDATVDFIVDLFDRADADSLGTYWEGDVDYGSVFSIRNGYAVSNGSGGGGYNLSVVNSALFDRSGFGDFDDLLKPEGIAGDRTASGAAKESVSLSGRSSGAGILNHYLNPLSNVDMVLEVTFDLAEESVETEITGSDENLTGEITATNYSIASACINCALRVDSTGKKKIRVSYAVNKLPSYTLSAKTVTLNYSATYSVGTGNDLATSGSFEDDCGTYDVGDSVGSWSAYYYASNSTHTVNASVTSTAGPLSINGTDVWSYEVDTTGAETVEIVSNDNKPEKSTSTEEDSGYDIATKNYLHLSTAYIFGITPILDDGDESGECKFNWSRDTHSYSDTMSIRIVSETVTTELDYDSTLSGLSRASDNILRIEVIGTNVATYFNGSLVDRSEQNNIIEGQKIGLGSTGAYVDAFLNASKKFGITKIKAWADGTPEPSGDQSGHGTYDSDTGKHSYTDKYHTTDPDTGVVSYNPDA